MDGNALTTSAAFDRVYASATCQRALSALAARDHSRAELHRKACRTKRMRRRARADHLRMLAARDESRARDLQLEVR